MIEKIMDKIFDSKDLTREFEALQTMEEILDFLRKFDGSITDYDLTNYIVRLIGSKNSIGDKLDDEFLDNVSGGKLFDNKKLLASMLSALTAASFFGVGNSKAAGPNLWQKMNSTEKAVTVTAGSAVLGATAITLGVLIHRLHKERKMEKNLDDLEIKLNQSKSELEKSKVEMKKSSDELNKLDSKVESNEKIKLYRDILIQSEKINVENIKLTDDINSSKRKIFAIEEHIKHLENQIEHLGNTNPYLRNKLIDLRMSSKHLEENRDKLSSQYNELSDLHRKLENRVSSLRKSVDNLKNEIRKKEEEAKRKAEEAKRQAAEAKRKAEEAKRKSERNNRTDVATQTNQERNSRADVATQTNQERNSRADVATQTNQAEETNRREEEARRQAEENRRREEEARRQAEEKERKDAESKRQYAEDGSDWKQRVEDTFGVKLKPVK